MAHAKRSMRFRPELDNLEGRALLSRFGAGHGLGPMAFGGIGPRAAFVLGLYQNTLGFQPEMASVRFWAGLLERRVIGPARLALFFQSIAASNGSLPGRLPGGGLNAVQGAITAITINPNRSSAGTGTTRAQVDTTYNSSDKAFTITLQISGGGGSFTLDQTNSWGILNSTGTTWKTYTIAIDTTSSTAANPYFTQAQNLGKVLKTITPNPSTKPLKYTFSGTSYPQNAGDRTQFQPLLVFHTDGPGTVVIKETFTT